MSGSAVSTSSSFCCWCHLGVGWFPFWLVFWNWGCFFLFRIGFGFSGFGAKTKMGEGERFQLGTVGALTLSVVSSVSIVICNKALMSSLHFIFGKITSLLIVVASLYPCFVFYFCHFFVSFISSFTNLLVPSVFVWFRVCYYNWRFIILTLPFLLPLLLELEVDPLYLLLLLVMYFASDLDYALT